MPADQLHRRRGLLAGPAGQHQEGPVPVAVGDAERRRQGALDRQRRRSWSASAASRFGYNNLVVRHALARGDARAPAARSCSTRRTRCSCRAGRAMPRAASASSCRCWRAPRSRPGSPALFMETHPDPAKALSDGPNAWPLERMESLLATLVESSMRSRAVEEATGPSRNPCMSRNRRHSRPRDHRFARQPHRRGRRDCSKSGAVGRAAVPSGASTGTREAVELRDARSEALRRQGRDEGRRPRQRRAQATRWSATTRRPGGRSTRRMIALDGTESKSRLGANAILAVSLAAAHAAAREAGVPLCPAAGRGGAGDAAGSDDEHHQRRRACQQQPRHPGVHDPPASARRRSPRPCAMAPRCSTR